MSIPSAVPDPPQIVVAVLKDRDHVLLCHRSPQRRWYPNVWDLPGGHVDPGESPSQALVRELREELGIAVAEPSSSPRAVINTDDFRMQIWLVESWSGAIVNTAPEEHDDLAWVNLDGFRNLPLAHAAYPQLLTEILTEGTGP